MPDSEAELLRRAARGDKEALNRVLRASLPRVRAWCLRLGGPRVEAEDAAQTVLVTTIKKGQELRGPKRLEAWLFGLTRRVLADARKLSWNRRERAELPVLLDGAPDPSVQAELRAELRWAQGILETLPEHLREVFVLSDLEERTQPEVAELLELPLGTVASRLRKARTLMRDAAQEEEER